MTFNLSRKNKTTRYYCSDHFGERYHRPPVYPSSPTPPTLPFQHHRLQLQQQQQEQENRGPGYRTSTCLSGYHVQSGDRLVLVCFCLTWVPTYLPQPHSASGTSGSALAALAIATVIAIAIAIAIAAAQRTGQRTGRWTRWTK